MPDFVPLTDTSIGSYDTIVHDLESLAENCIGLDMTKDTLRWVGTLQQSVTPGYFDLAVTSCIVSRIIMNKFGKIEFTAENLEILPKQKRRGAW